MCLLGSKKYYFFGKLLVRTLWMAPNSVSVGASMMHLKAIILRIFREKSFFGLATNFQKSFGKLILGNLGTRIFKNFSLVQAVVVLPGETNISNLLTAPFIFIRPPSLKVGSVALTVNVLNAVEISIVENS